MFSDNICTGKSMKNEFSKLNLFYRTWDTLTSSSRFTSSLVPISSVISNI